MTKSGRGLNMDADGYPAAASRCPPQYQGMHLKKQQARQLSYSTFYLQRGFQGSACVPSPGVCLPPGGPRAGTRRGALPPAPEGGRGTSSAGAAPVTQEAFVGRDWARGGRPRAGGGQRPRSRQRVGGGAGPLIAPGRSVGAASCQASPGRSRCWRWARGSRRRGGAAPAPPPGRGGPRCWRGSPGWTGRCSARRRTLRRGGGTHTTRRDTNDSALQRGPALPAPSAAGSGGGPPPLRLPTPPPRFPPPPPRLGLTVCHVGAVDGVEAAASRRPDGAATVGL